ncbi:MAG: histone deacetylase [Candidatus Woesearchaeota archaeon]
MKLLFNKIFLEHDTGMHPENRKRLDSLGSLEETEILPMPDLLELVHTRQYIKGVKKACKTSGHLDPDTVTSQKSYEAAVAAATATVMASETNDFALVRPPGHHAHPDRSSGFCIFNNIAIAVRKLLMQKKRVLIFDFDGHCGDGTSKIFYDSDKALYISLHQFPAFPGFGSADEIGSGKGRGYTINVPLPPGAADDIFLDAVDRVLLIAKQFKPDCVAVSAGFDSHQHDLLLDLRLSANAYYELGKKLRIFPNIFATLEGGYNVEVFPKCLHNFVDAMNGRQQQYFEDSTDSRIIVAEELESRMARLEKVLCDYWKV